MSPLKPARGKAVPNLVDQLIELHHLCFGKTVGTIPFSREYLQWFLSRPGLGCNHVFAMVKNRRLISSLFLTRIRIILNGYPVDAGIIDSLMTHPDYRQQGLASATLACAQKVSREEGCAFSLLYTLPRDPQFSFYLKKGYFEYARLLHMLRDEGNECPEPCPPFAFSHDMLRIFLNRRFKLTNGFIPLTPRQWAWRKCRRPSSVPARIFSVGDSRLQATLTAAITDIVLSDGLGTTCFISDWAATEKHAAEEVIRLALSETPSKIKVDVPVCSLDYEKQEILKRLGFFSVAEDVLMIYPLHEKALSLLRSQCNRPWYTLLESTIGA